MQIYLPVAEIPVDVFIVLGIGLVAGFFGGVFGIGGGFLATPFLIFSGIPPAMAVATSTNQIIASSTSGLLVHLKKGNVDTKMGSILVAGGFIGTSCGMIIFRILQNIGKIDIAVSFIYVLFLGSIGLTMAIRNLHNIIEKKYDVNYEKKKESFLDKFHKKITNLPFQVEFPKSEVKVSIIVPFILSILVGVLVALMGVGGGFLMIPAMISILRMNQNVVTGTSLFQIIFIASLATFFQAMNNNIDIALTGILIFASAAGSQFGSKLSYKIDPDIVRIGLALLMLLVCVKIVISLFSEPASIYSLELIK